MLCRDVEVDVDVAFVWGCFSGLLGPRPGLARRVWDGVSSGAGLDGVLDGWLWWCSCWGVGAGMFRGIGSSVAAASWSDSSAATDFAESKLSLGVIVIISERISSTSEASLSPSSSPPVSPYLLESAAANSAISLIRSVIWSSSSLLRFKSAWRSCLRTLILMARASCSIFVRRDRA